MDLIARKTRETMFSLDERDDWIVRRRDADRFVDSDGPNAVATEEPGNPFPSDLIRQAEEIQATVRGRVAPRTWEAFWLVGVLLWTVEETAEHLQMSHASVYKAKERVLKSLRAEGRKRRAAGDSG